jgi:cation-transporting P-type ATPase E
VSEAPRPAPTRGLTRAEAERRLAERGPIEPPATSRSTASIVRANVFTLFNAILLGLGILTLAFGYPQDALFLGILIANAGIGIAQELRAKKALDKLAALVAPDATVVRDGQPHQVPVEGVVVGDLVRVQAGDQIVADGTLVESEALALDESILTGESRPAPRTSGEAVRSGSFAVEGAGAYTVTAVGDESYAQRIAGEAREFRHPRSPLERVLNRMLVILVCVMVPLGTILVYSLWQRDEGVREAVTTAVAGIVTLVPEGLILLTSLTFAAAAFQLTRRGALAQQLNAVESLASVDVICLDKTGTLTQPGLRVVAVEPESIREALGRFAASSPAKNATLKAIAEAVPAEPEEVLEYEPFTSSKRYSAVRLREGRYVLGAPELFGVEGEGDGRRVVAFGQDDFRPLGRVILAEELRPEARQTVEFFHSQGVDVKVLSGDDPATVKTIAGDAGIDAEAVMGRVSPQDKKVFVESLRDEGRYVAMVGDGVNDVPALKAARLAIAQGSGSEMARSVADVVLVRGDFAAVPAMVAEGRKILRNVQRVAKLFVTKSVFAAFLILLIGVTDIAYPLLPRHLSLAAALTVGIPGFVLALAPSEGSWRPTGFLRDVARFAVPAGTAAGLGVLAAYHFSLSVVEAPLVEARTVATSVLILVGLYLLLALETAGCRRAPAAGPLCLGLLVLYALVLASGGLRGFFDLAVPDAWEMIAILGGTGLAITGLVFTDERFVPNFRALGDFLVSKEHREIPSASERAAERAKARRTG